jgi:hypothetical protein
MRSSWGRTMGCLGLLKESTIATRAMGCDSALKSKTSAHLGRFRFTVEDPGIGGSSALMGRTFMRRWKKVWRGERDTEVV